MIYILMIFKKVVRKYGYGSARPCDMQMCLEDNAGRWCVRRVGEGGGKGGREK